MKAIYNNMRVFFNEKEEYFNPTAFIVAVVILATFVATSFYIMAWSLTN